MYLMQILRIGSSDMLTFFDSGATVNLIDGDIATHENLPCISDKPTSLSFVGCSIHAAKIPISKIRELVDQDDIEQLVTYRCAKCSCCVECKKTP